MSYRLLATSGVCLGAMLLSGAGSADAQDMNTLSRHLEHQQSMRVQDHQNRIRSPDSPPRRGDRAVSESQSTVATPECTADALPAAERRALETRFNQIDRAQGRAAAMAYVREQGRLFRQRLVEEGVCD